MNIEDVIKDYNNIREILMFSFQDDINHIVANLKNIEWNEIKEFENIVTECTNTLMNKVKEKFKSYSYDNVWFVIEDELYKGYHDI